MAGLAGLLLLYGGVCVHSGSLSRGLSVTVQMLLALIRGDKEHGEYVDAWMREYL